MRPSFWLNSGKAGPDFSLFLLICSPKAKSTKWLKVLLTLHTMASLASMSRPAILISSASSDGDPSTASTTRLPPSDDLGLFSTTNCSMLSSATMRCAQIGADSSMNLTCKSAPFAPCTSRCSQGLPRKAAAMRPDVKSGSSCETKIRQRSCACGPKACSRAARVNCRRPLARGLARRSQSPCLGLPARPYVRTQISHWSLSGC
mmetsp:Transcript_99085/g.178941  ORF Transcript_99085/g.178941 Transcript_99085/m.178941 type:complete len:204 (-) Transcript_99085:687-1298(-)